MLRLWRSLLLIASRWFQLESLYRSNVKYHPEWLPRFLCYEDVRDLPKVGLASAAAEGFVAVPRLRDLLRRRATKPLVDDRRDLIEIDTTASEAPRPGTRRPRAGPDPYGEARHATGRGC